MAASVTVEATAFTDGRYAILGKLLPGGRAAAYGAMVLVWEYCTERQVYVVDGEMLDAITGFEGVGPLMKRARLCEEVEGGYRVCGTAGRIEWLLERRSASKKGGEANRKRWESQRASQEGAKAEPTRSQVASQNGAKREPNRSPSSSSSSSSSGSVSAVPADRAKECCKDDPAHRTVAAEHAFCVAHREARSVPYAHSYGRDRKEIDRLPAEYTREKLLALVPLFFERADRWTRERRGLNIPAFVQAIPALLAHLPETRAPPLNDPRAEYHLVEIEAEAAAAGKPSPWADDPRRWSMTEDVRGRPVEPVARSNGA